MRVLIISTRYKGGGAERSAREMFHALTEVGISASMLVSIRDEKDPEEVVQSRLPGERYLQVVRRAWGPVDWIHFGSKIALNRVNRENCDVVHMHNIHGSWISLSAVGALCRRIPTVWTLHDQWAPTGGLACDLSHLGGKYGQALRAIPDGDLLLPNTRASNQVRQFLEPRLPQPDTIICPSRFLHNLTIKSGKFPRARVLRLANGLMMQRCQASRMEREEARSHFGIEPGDRVALLSVPRMDGGIKGIPLVVDALNTLPANALTLLAMGAGSKEFAGAIPQRVIATGFLDNDDSIARAYRAASVTLVPSAMENFPYTALESMACETPVVSFDVGGFSEIIGENERGLRTTPFDISGYAQNIMHVLDSESLGARLGKAGRDWVAKECDFDRCVSAHQDIYREAIARFIEGGNDYVDQPPPAIHPERLVEAAERDELAKE